MIRTLTPTEYRLLVENSPVMIWRAGPDAKCDYFNEPWLAFTGRTLEQEIGDGWAQGVHPDDFDRCVTHYLDHFRARQPFEMEYRLRRHDGVHRWIFDRGVPFDDEAGAFAGFIGSCVDVHERRRVEAAQQRRSQEQLTLARDFETWVLAIVGHDIRDPLNAIQLAAHGLMRAADSSGVVRKNAEVVTRGVNRIQHIVADLLDLSRVRQGGGIPIEPKPGDLRAMCLRIVEELKGTARDRRITFDCEGDVSGTWDEHRILQTISNLTSNAVQHGTPGSPVRLSLTGNPERVAVAVYNEGAIPEELLPRIFEPFHSSRHHSGRGDGLGLGLFIAREIARAHGGDLEVDSSDGVTIFRLLLPRHAGLGSRNTWLAGG